MGFSEYESPEHEAKATELLTELGRFVVAFERVCAGMRACIHAAFRHEGLSNQGLSQIVVNGKAAAALRELIGAVLAEMRELDDADRTCVKGLLNRIATMATNRNNLLHGEWYLNYDYDNATDEFFALALKFKASQRDGATYEAIDVSKRELAGYIDEAKAIQVLLHRLAICLNQKGFKISEQFARPL